MSVSYLNEIEKGKKFPKAAKLKSLAKALEVPEQALTSGDLDKALAPVGQLLQSNFLNELPLDLFGIELAKVVDIIANAPARVGAFISTLLEISRSYALKEEKFYFSALRSYLELHHNYFEDIEEAVNRFCTLYSVPENRPLTSKDLKALLEDRFKYKIEEDGLDKFPELLSLRAVFLPKGKRLLLNSQLNAVQRGFQFGKELGFQFLELKERAHTSSLLRSKVFEEVLNHSKATYFSVALHIPRDPFLAQMRAFFERSTWNGEAFLQIMQAYDATPEMFYHRLTNVLPRFFNMRKLFFMRVVHNPKEDHFEIDRELHLDRRHHPHGNALSEHYCRRWVSLSLLKDLYQMQGQGMLVNTIVRAQRSTYIGTQDDYLCFTLARPSYPTPNKNVSVTLGLLVNEQTREQIKFLEDPAIQVRAVNNTCERCAVENCAERAVPPVVINRRDRLQQIESRLKELSS